MGYADLERIYADLEHHRTIFDLDRETLGERLLDVATIAITESFDRQENPQGEAWPELSTAYALWKEEHYPGCPIGVRERLLRDEAQMEGIRIITPRHAYQIYGDGDELARDEAFWFSRRRPFYGFTADGRDRSKELLTAHFWASMRMKGTPENAS